MLVKKNGNFMAIFGVCLPYEDLVYLYVSKNQSIIISLSRH